MHAREIAPHIAPELDQKSMFVYLVKTFVWPGRRTTYDGKPVELPPSVADESLDPRAPRNTGRFRRDHDLASSVQPATFRGTRGAFGARLETLVWPGSDGGAGPIALKPVESTRPFGRLS